MKEQLHAYFKNVKDPRSIRNQKHQLITLIGTTLLAMLSGIDSFTGIQDFVEMHLDELSVFFDFPNGLPSHDTYQRLWDSIDPSQFKLAFMDFVNSLEKVEGNLINIDGKTIRNSNKGEEKALHIVSAWCQANKIVLAQEKTDSKSNEIKAIPKLLELLDLSGRIITLDAMGAQRDICQQIIDQNGDYVIALKGNQGSLHEDVALYLKNPQHHESVNENNDKGHGRLEQRIAGVSRDIDWLQEVHNWPGLVSIGQVAAIVLRNGKETRETRYYISSLPLDAQQLNDFVRAHWSIENQLHWVIDVTLNEDKACIRNNNSAENMDIMRKWALNILSKAKDKPERSIKSLMRKNAMSIQHLCDCVQKIFHA